MNTRQLDGASQKTTSIPVAKLVLSTASRALTASSRHLFVALAISVFLLGCSHTIPPTTPLAETKPEGARMSRTQAVRIAAAAARKHGYRLDDYKDAKADYEFIRKNRTWSVFYDGKVPMPGNHFLVWVDDQTGEARVMPGE